MRDNCMNRWCLEPVTKCNSPVGQVLALALRFRDSRMWRVIGLVTDLPLHDKGEGRSQEAALPTFEIAQGGGAMVEVARSFCERPYKRRQRRCNGLCESCPHLEGHPRGRTIVRRPIIVTPPIAARWIDHPAVGDRTNNGPPCFSRGNGGSAAEVGVGS